jgi:exoribonuclease R
MTSKTNTDLRLGCTLVLNTKYVFKRTGKTGYICIPQKVSQIQYILFTDKIDKYLQKNSIDSSNNIYVVIKPSNKVYHESTYEATLLEIIGTINCIENQYKILLYYHELFPINIKKYSQKLDTQTKENLQSFINTLKPTFVHNVFSIDPESCIDIDDALTYLDEDNFVVHIADPNRFNSVINLNQYYENNTSIYLGDKTYHLLPLELSTNYISLIENTVRPVISVYFSFVKTDLILKKIVRNTIIVTKNLSYNKANSMLSDSCDISKLFEISKRLVPIFYKDDKVLIDTHDMVELFMLAVNNEIGNFLQTNFIGDVLYRTCNDNNTKYSYTNSGHDKLFCKNYVHFSSPIRRTADYIIHQKVISLLDCKNLLETVEYQIKNMDHFNDSITTIKKISNMGKYIQVANSIVNGNIYQCKLLNVDGLTYKWLIIDKDLKFKCDICHTDFITDKIKEILQNMKINKIYNIKLYKTTVGKLQSNKIMFEFDLFL